MLILNREVVLLYFLFVWYNFDYRGDFMVGDNFEVEELIVPIDELDIYRKRILVDDVIEEFDKEELEELGINYDDLVTCADKHGLAAARKFIDYLKQESAVEKDDLIDSTDRLDKDKNVVDDIDLSTPSFISTLNNEEIRLDRMSIYDRIGEIYYHTGISVGSNDSVFVFGYNKGINSFNDFLNSLPLECINDLKVRLGEDWKEQMLQTWTDGWNKEINNTINKEKDKATNRLRENLKNEKMKNEQLSERVGILSALNNIEKRRNTDLAFNVNMLETSRNDALDQLRDAKEVLSQKQSIDNVPDFVTNDDMNVYDYVVSQDVVNPEGKSK